MIHSYCRTCRVDRAPGKGGLERRVLRLSALAAALVLALPGWAQDSNQPTAPGDSANQRKVQQLQEVTVTAEHQTKSVQKTAISIAVINGEDAREKGQTVLAQALNDTPGLIGAGIAARRSGVHSRRRRQRRQQLGRSGSIADAGQRL